MVLNAGMNTTLITIRFTSRTTMVGRSGGSMTPRVMKPTSKITMAMKSGITPKETAFIYGTMKVKNGLPKATKKERLADKEKKNPSSMSFTVYFRGDLQYEGTLNLNDGKISIYYTKKSIKNTNRGYCSPNNSLFLKYAEKGLDKMYDTVNSQLRKLYRENSVVDAS